MRHLLICCAALLSAPNLSFAAGHYCDDAPEHEKQMCNSARIRSDDDCTRVGNDEERLICWDRERALEDCENKYKRTIGQTYEQCISQFDVTSEDQDEPQQQSAWNVRKETSTFEDTNDVFLRLNANETVSCGLNRASRYTLLLRCMENTTALFFVGDCHLASGHGGYGRVDVRVDDRAARTISMDAATNNKALGLFSGRKSIPVIKRWLSGDTMAVRFTPFGETPVEMSFPIAGLDKAIEPLRKSCGW